MLFYYYVICRILKFILTFIIVSLLPDEDWDMIESMENL